LVWLATNSIWLANASGETSIEITFLDKTSGERISSRVEFVKPLTKAPRPRGALVAGRQLLVEKTAHFAPAPGAYEFMVRRGPEFSEIRGGFAIEKNAQDAIEVYVPHKTPMRSNGWHSGDLHSPMADQLLARWMRADDLDVVVSTDSNATQTPANTQAKSSLNYSPGRFDASVARESSGDKKLVPQALNHVQTHSILWDRPDQCGLLVHQLNALPLDPTVATSFALFEQIQEKESSFIEVTKPWDRDLPLLLATGRVDAIQLLSNHLRPDSCDPISIKVRNPDPLRFKGKKALARLSEHLYWKILDAGLRLPPTAGSGFDGKSLTHLGYNRVYVWLAPELPRSIESWWSQLRAGHTMVTNGPLLYATINGLPAGSVHPSYRREPIPLDIELELTVRDPVEYLDVVFNGKAIYQARLEDHAKRGQFPPLNITESGWLVLRVVTEHEDSYRMATTAPFYFEFDGQPRVSRSAVQFFQDWLDEIRVPLERNTAIHPSYLTAIGRAKEFWNERASIANAE